MDEICQQDEKNQVLSMNAWLEQVSFLNFALLLCQSI